jgi:hypothetical protein
MNTNTIPAQKVASGLVSENALNLARQALVALNDLYWTDELSKSQKKKVIKALDALNEFVRVDLSDDVLDDPF